MTATGFLTASQDVQDAAIAVFCFDGDGTVIGVTTTNLVQNITGGERKAFETIQSTPPLDPGQCAETRGYASDTGF